jgi:hypothetical protein
MYRKFVLYGFLISILFLTRQSYAEENLVSVDLNDFGIPKNINSMYVSNANGGQFSDTIFKETIKSSNLNNDYNEQYLYKSLLLAFSTIEQNDSIYGIYGIFTHYNNLYYTSYTNYNIIQRLLNVALYNNNNIHVFFYNKNNKIIQVESKSNNVYNIFFSKNNTDGKYEINITNSDNKVLFFIPFSENNEPTIHLGDATFPLKVDTLTKTESFITNTKNIPFDDEINKNYPQYFMLNKNNKSSIVHQYVYNDGLFLILDLVNHLKKNIISLNGLYTFNMEPIISFTDYSNYFLKAENHNDIIHNKNRFILSYENNNDYGDNININGIDLKTYKLLDISTDVGDFYSIYWTRIPLITLDKNGTFVFHYAGYIYDNKMDKIIYSQVDINNN